MLNKEWNAWQGPFCSTAPIEPAPESTSTGLMVGENGELAISFDTGDEIEVYWVSKVEALSLAKMILAVSA